MLDVLRGAIHDFLQHRFQAPPFGWVPDRRNFAGQTSGKAAALEAVKKAVDENYSTYSPVEGYLELREAICKKFKRDNNLEYKILARLRNSTYENTNKVTLHKNTKSSKVIHNLVWLLAGIIFT